MYRLTNSWVVAVILLLGTVTYVLAEDITVTTFYPSPRGVYNQLRTMGQTTLAETAGNNVGIGIVPPAAPNRILHINGGAGASRVQFTSGATTGTTIADGAEVGLDGFDANLGLTIWNYENAGLRLGTNNLARMTILGNGNVGIGTVAPGSRLTVQGTGTTLATSSLNVTNSTPTSLFFVRDDGNVGIGTTAPTTILDIRRTVDSVPLQLVGPTHTTQLSEVGDGTILKTVTNGDLYFGANNTEWMRIKASGNVGIGMTAPDYKLTVSGGAQPMHVIGLFPGYGQIYLDANSAITSDNWILGGVDDANGGFVIRSPNSGITALYAHQNGNVGIGTTAPSGLLHLVGDGKNLLRLEGTPGGVAQILFRSATDTASKFFFMGPGYNTANVFSFGSTDSGTTLNVTQAGNVGIGTTVPDQRLHVVGNIHATGLIVADSDARFKQDLQPLTGVLEKLEGLTPLSYESSAVGIARGQPAGERQLGLLGQELEQVYPELVVVSGEEQYRAVDYSRLTVVLLEAVKELKAEVSRLQARVEELEGGKPR